MGRWIELAQDRVERWAGVEMLREAFVFVLKPRACLKFHT